MKKALSFLLSLILLGGAVSCGKVKPDPEPAPTKDDIEMLSFRSADIRMADDFTELICTDKSGGSCLIFGKLRTGGFGGYISNLSFTEKTAFSFDAQEGERVLYAALMHSGKPAVLTILGGETMIYTLSYNGDVENVYDLGEVIGNDEPFAELLCAEDGFYINIARHTLVYAGSDGNFKGEVNIGGGSICGLVTDIDRKPCVLLSEDMRTTLSELSGGETVNEISCGTLADYTNGLCTGSGEYRIFALVGDGLYGLSGSSWINLSDFSDNDLSIAEIWDIESLGGNEFAVMLPADKSKMRLLSQRDISEIKEKKLIRMANLVQSTDSPYNELMRKYNSESTDYKLEIVTYKGGLSEDIAGELKMDIISGNAPDIVVFNGSIPVDSFGSADSMFVDFYGLMDSDPDISRSDFMDGFLEGMETGGKLLQIGSNFDVSSILIKDKFAQGMTSWDLDQFGEICSAMPDKMRFSAEAAIFTKADMLDRIVDYRRFIDKNSASCNFDSPKFIQAMKMIKENDIGISANSDSIGIMTAYEEIAGFINDELLVRKANMSGFSYVREYLRLTGGDNCTFIGFPDDDGITAVSQISNTYGIMANSENIAGAWDFLKFYLLSEDSFRSNKYFFSGIEKYYQLQLEDICKPRTITDYDTGEEVNIDVYTYYLPDTNEPVNVDLPPFTKAEAEKYDKFVREALKHPMFSEAQIRRIVREETTSYFENERTAEEAANIIQNRISIYMSENYG